MTIVLVTLGALASVLEVEFSNECPEKERRIEASASMTGTTAPRQTFLRHRIGNAIDERFLLVKPSPLKL